IPPTPTFTLFPYTTLFRSRVAIDFPSEVFRLAVHLFERLIDRDRADRHRRIADDPFARFVDVLAGRQIHHRVGAPARRPRHLLRSEEHTSELQSLAYLVCR